MIVDTASLASAARVNESSAPQRLIIARALVFGAALARIDVEPLWRRYESLARAARIPRANAESGIE